MVYIVGKFFVCEKINKNMNADKIKLLLLQKINVGL